MSFKFEWNDFTDQPHNVAPRKERLKYHLEHRSTYFSLLAKNLRLALPVLKLYRKYRKNMYKQPVKLENAFAVSISPVAERNEEVIENLKEIGVQKTLFRIPSWETERLDFYGKFAELLQKHNLDPTIALLQQREDIICPARWKRN